MLLFRQQGLTANIRKLCDKTIECGHREELSFFRCETKSGEAKYLVADVEVERRRRVGERPREGRSGTKRERRRRLRDKLVACQMEPAGRE